MESGRELPRSLQERTNKGFYSEKLFGRRENWVSRAVCGLVKFDPSPLGGGAGAPSLACPRVMILDLDGTDFTSKLVSSYKYMHVHALSFTSTYISALHLFDSLCLASCQTQWPSLKLTSSTHHIRCSRDNIAMWHSDKKKTEQYVDSCQGKGLSITPWFSVSAVNRYDFVASSLVGWSNACDTIDSHGKEPDRWGCHTGSALQLFGGRYAMLHRMQE